MESSCQKGLVYGDLMFGQESLAGRNLSVGWEVNVPEYGAECLISEIGSDNFIKGIHVEENCCDSGNIGRTVNVGLPNALSVDDELSTKFASPFSESDCKDYTLMNIKLGGLENHQFSRCLKSFHRSSTDSSRLVKRSRSAGLNSQTFFCQVLGCNKDLSSSKDYHKKHRVCDSHSKTAKVMVNGIEQRFCQQCSRFHLLGEFDEGKRSCRRRLAGHNKRRRKPHMGNLCDRNRSCQSYNVGVFDEMSTGKTSSISNKIFHADPLLLGKLGANGRNQQINADDENDYSEFFAYPQANSNLHLGDMILYEKQYPCVHGSASNDYSKSIVNDTDGSHLHDIPGIQCSDISYTFMRSENQDTNIFCTESNLNGFSTTASLNAPSLLSSQSQNSPSYSTGIPIAQTWSFTSNPPHCSVRQVSDTPPKSFPISYVNGVSHKLAACELNPGMRVLHRVQIPEDDAVVKYNDSEFFEGLIYDDIDGVSREDGLTMDLLQLPTYLQRSEHLMPLADICNTSRYNRKRKSSPQSSIVRVARHRSWLLSYKVVSVCAVRVLKCH